MRKNLDPQKISSIHPWRFDPIVGRSCTPVPSTHACVLPGDVRVICQVILAIYLLASRALEWVSRWIDGLVGDQYSNRLESLGRLGELKSYPVGWLCLRAFYARGHLDLTTPTTCIGLLSSISNVTTSAFAHHSFSQSINELLRSTFWIAQYILFYMYK